jgi:hypothetical protein
MTISKIGWLLFAGAGVACASSEGETRAEGSRIDAAVIERGDACTVVECIDVIADERLLYLSIEGRDCDGATIWDFELEAQAPDGAFIPTGRVPLWGTSDPDCIGKSETMWHFHDLARGTYRLCARFHGTLSPGEMVLHARAAGGICDSHPFVAACSHCDASEMGEFDAGSEPQRIAPRVGEKDELRAR